MSTVGYRTVIVFGIVTVAGIFGHHLPPEVIQTYATDIIEIAGVAGVVLRLITNTPFGQKKIQQLEQSGVSSDLVGDVLAKLPQQADLSTLLTKVQELEGQISKPVNPPTIPEANVGGQINAG